MQGGENSIFLLKDTLTCNWGEPGFELATFRSLVDPLYLLIYSRPSPLQLFFSLRLLFVSVLTQFYGNF